MVCHRPFCKLASLALFAVAAVALLTATAPARAQITQGAATQSAPPADSAKADNVKTDRAKPDATNAPVAQPGNVAAAGQANPPPPQTFASKTIEKVKQVAKSAADIFSRVPCLPPKGGVNPVGSLPHVAGKLASGEPVVIVAFGSSTTTSWGISSPEFAYPDRLAAQLRRQYPGADITVLTRGKGGEDAPEMMNRLQTAVLDAHPDLVIWQVGTNAVLRNLDPAVIGKDVEDGVAQIQAIGADVVLVDPQYSPRVNEHAEGTSQMVKLLGKVAALRHIGIFPRFEVMREWHEKQDLPIDDFVIADGLHMNDWGYACFAQMLGDDIIRSVGQIKLGINVPAGVQTYRPM